MYSLEPFKIDLKAISGDDQTFEFRLDHAYFEAMGATDISNGDLYVRLFLHKASDFFELSFHIEGLVEVPCDLCLDVMTQTVDADERMIAKFGNSVLFEDRSETQYSEDDELVIVSEHEGILDVSWFIYEFIELNIPIKHVHAPGKCNHAMMELLEEHSAARSSEVNVEHAIDQRWAELQKLKTIIKD